MPSILGTVALLLHREQQDAYPASCQRQRGCDG